MLLMRRMLGCCRLADRPAAQEAMADSIHAFKEKQAKKATA
jgi:hypothetical protein